MQKIDQERLDKSLELYKDELCKTCLEKFHSKFEGVNITVLDDEEQKKHYRKVAKAMLKLCRPCIQRLTMKSVSSGDIKELQRKVQGVRR